MAAIEVKTNKLESYARDLRSIASTLKRLDSSIDSCNRNISTAVSSANYNVKRNLTSVSNSFVKDIQTMEKMAQVLDQAAVLYKSVERKICDYKVTIEEPDKAEDEATIIWGKIKDLLINLISPAGIIGGTADLVWDILNGKDITANVLKWVADTTGTVLKEVSDDAPDWLAAVTGYTDEVYDSVKDFFVKKLDDLLIDSGASKCANGAVIAGWISVIIDGVMNFTGNMEEFGSEALKNSRFWAETILETAIDFGKGIVVGAAVVGIAVAAGVSAPVWAVALISGAVISVADTAFEIFFDKDMTEVITDGILDAIEGIKDFIGDATTADYDEISVAWA